jgi:hypothetical protein
MAMVAEQFAKRKNQLSVDRQGLSCPGNNMPRDVCGGYLSSMDITISYDDYSLLEDIPGLFL